LHRNLVSPVKIRKVNVKHQQTVTQLTFFTVTLAGQSVNFTTCQITILTQQ